MIYNLLKLMACISFSSSVANNTVVLFKSFIDWHVCHVVCGTNVLSDVAHVWPEDRVLHSLRCSVSLRLCAAVDKDLF